MAKNANFVSHKKSKLKENGGPKLPLASDLVEGEIAINFAENVETLSIKNESGDVVTFSSDNYYTEQKLGSGFTGENSGRTVTEYIEENELIVSTALNDLKENKLDVSAYTEPTEYWISGTGENSVVLKGSSGTASGNLSVAEGQQTSATSLASHAEGTNTQATSTAAHAEGQGSQAIGSGSHAEGGGGARAIGVGSHAEGQGTAASGTSSHAEGQGTAASGTSSHAEGQGTHANGNFSHAEGVGTSSNGDNSHAEGNTTYANGQNSHAEGFNTQASGTSSHAEGQGTHANGDYSHAEGQNSVANYDGSHAEGISTLATSSGSHAEGQNSKATGSYSHAEGTSTSATSIGSHAEGSNTVSEGLFTHAEGKDSKASGNYSHAEGNNTTASGESSHAEGYYTKTTNDYEHASGRYNVSNSATTEFGDSGNTLFSVGNGTADDARHNAFEIRQNGDIYIVNKDGNDVKLQDEIGNITVDQVLDNTTSASTNPVSSKAVYDAVTDNELVWTNAFVTLSGVTSAHTADTTIHLTSTEKGQLHTHSNKSYLDSISDNVGTMAYQNTSSYSSATQVNTALSSKLESSDIADFFDNAKYEDSGTTKVINFYHGDTIKTTIDASDFIVDGMVDDVRIENGNLVIDFNTASGKQDISIPLTDIFDPSNYYDKDDIDDLVGSGFTSSSITEVIIENEEIVSAALTDLDERKLDASAYTPTDLSNYYTKSETSGATELATAFSGKLDATAYTPTDLSNYYTKSETSGATELTTAFSAKADTATTLAGYGIADAYTKSETSGATEISNALQGKVNTSDIISAITPSNSGSTNPIATSVVAENELTVSNALIDLDERKLDASAYTPTDLSNYYTKSETSGATEISNALGGKVNSATFTGHTADTTAHLTSAERTAWNSFSAETNASINDLSGQSETVAVALNDLNENKLDITAYTPTDLSNYYTKSETSGATELATALSNKADKTAVDDLSGQSETIAAALVGLNENKADLSTTLSGYGITDAYTKTEIDNMIGNIETLLAAI